MCKPVWENIRSPQKYTRVQAGATERASRSTATTVDASRAISTIRSRLLDDLSDDSGAARQGALLHRDLSAMRAGSIRCRSRWTTFQPVYTQHVTSWYKTCVMKPCYQDYQVPVKWTTCKPIYEQHVQGASLHGLQAGATRNTRCR